MGRPIRLKGPEIYHHVFNRGNDRHPVFKKSSDYKRYLFLLKLYSGKYDIQVLAYALMEWHIHLFVYDETCRISEFIKELHGHYAKLYNHYYERTSHVFGGRFKNRIVDANEYGLWLTRYIHRQAVEAGIVDSPEDYRWTSYLHYINKIKNSFVDNNIIMGQFGSTEQEQVAAYRKFVLSDDEGPINWEQAQLNPQLVIGSKVFIQKIAKKLDNPDLIAPDINDAIKQICLQYNVTLADLKLPGTKTMRTLRHNVIYQLSTYYGIGAKKIANLLNVSVGLVSMITNNKYPYSYKTIRP